MYYQELGERYSRGEMASADSMKSMDSIAFKTPAGRIVYGGGGIMPDVFIPIDTSGYSSYLSEVSSKGLINRFAFQYIDIHRSEILAKFKTAKSFATSFNASPLTASFAAFAEKNGVKTDARGLQHSSDIIQSQIQALMGRALYGNEGFYSILNNRDKAIKKSIELLNSNKLVSTSNKGKTPVL
jgi:carboxyl-terminal processing protease